MGSQSIISVVVAVAVVVVGMREGGGENNESNTERKRKKAPRQIGEPTSQTMNQIQKKKKRTMTDQTSQPKMKFGILTQLNPFFNYADFCDQST